MIKIKDCIFNENDIRRIYYNKDKSCLCVGFRDEDLVTNFIEDATFEDIEWNYGTPQETQRQIQKELCKNCYYRDTISNKLKELEEENKTFEEYNKDLNNQLDKLEERIDKAIEYMENTIVFDVPSKMTLNDTYIIDSENYKKLLEILKGEENE